MLRPMLKTAELRVVRALPMLLALASGPVVLSGCAYGELKQVLRAQVAAETSCGDVTIESSPMFQPGHQPGQYRVKGCGVDRTYNCPKEDGLVSYGDKICTYVDSRSIKPPEPMPAADPTLDEGGEPLDPTAEPPADEPLDAPAD
jgi:hypothetical protein